MLAKILLQKLASESPVYLRVKVKPKSSKTEFVSIMADETIKIRLNAPPEKGKANQELIEYLSSLIHIPKPQIQIISGKTLPFLGPVSSGHKEFSLSLAFRAAEKLLFPNSFP